MGSAAHAELGLSRKREGFACSGARGKGLRMCRCNTCVSGTPGSEVVHTWWFLASGQRRVSGSVSPGAEQGSGAEC